MNFIPKNTAESLRFCKPFVVAALSLSLFASAVALAATSSTPVEYTNDALADHEPTVHYALGAATAGPVVVTMKEVMVGKPKNFFIADDGTTPISGYLPLPAGSDVSADPYLYASHTYLGTAPYRLYCVGIANTNLDPYTNKIVVWRSDDMGRDFANATPVVIDAAGESNDPVSGNVSKRLVDKPTIVVSHYSGDRGKVYVAYMARTRVETSGGSHVKTYSSFHVAKSADGGTTWTTARVWTNEFDANRDDVNSAHIVTANGTGYIYVAWVKYGHSNATAGQIMLARSPAAGTIAGTWVLDSAGPTGRMGPNTTTYGMKAMAIVIMRHHSPSNKLILTWSELVSSSTGNAARQNVYYAEKGAAGWSTWNGVQKLKLNSENPSCETDQARPTLDYDTTGTITVAYYDRQQNCANDPYNLVFTRLTTTSGTPATVAQAPTAAAPLSGSNASNLTYNAEKSGEYFDIWCEGTVCYTAWVGTPNNQGDILMTTIQ
jgi:hypothetical protein